MPQRFRKLPTEVEAVQWTGDNADELYAFAADSWTAIGPEDRADDPDRTAAVRDHLHNTWIGMRTGDWVMKGVVGEFYPCANDVLTVTYEPVSEPEPQLRAKDARVEKPSPHSDEWIMNDLLFRARRCEFNAGQWDNTGAAAEARRRNWEAKRYRQLAAVARDVWTKADAAEQLGIEPGGNGDDDA